MRFITVKLREIFLHHIVNRVAYMRCFNIILIRIAPKSGYHIPERFKVAARTVIQRVKPITDFREICTVIHGKFNIIIRIVIGNTVAVGIHDKSRVSVSISIVNCEILRNKAL